MMWKNWGRISVYTYICAFWKQMLQALLVNCEKFTAGELNVDALSGLLWVAEWKDATNCHHHWHYHRYHHHHHHHHHHQQQQQHILVILIQIRRVNLHYISGHLLWSNVTCTDQPSTTKITFSELLLCHMSPTHCLPGMANCPNQILVVLTQSFAGHASDIWPTMTTQFKI